MSSATCRMWLKAVRANAPGDVIQQFKGAAVLGDRFGYTVELADATQMYMGREHCRYCARASALSELCAAYAERQGGEL